MHPSSDTPNCHNVSGFKKLHSWWHMRFNLLFIITCAAFAGMVYSSETPEGAPEWSCKNLLGSEEVLRLHAGEDPAGSIGAVLFDGQRTEAAYLIQGLEHNWIWPVPEDSEDWSTAISDIQFQLRLRPNGVTHYFDHSLPEDEDGMITATMTFACERDEGIANSEQSTTSETAIPRETNVRADASVTLQCQDYQMPGCRVTQMMASIECEQKGYNGAVLKGVRQPGNLHDFECVK